MNTQRNMLTEVLRGRHINNIISNKLGVNDT